MMVRSVEYLKPRQPNRGVSRGAQWEALVQSHDGAPRGVPATATTKQGRESWGTVGSTRWEILVQRHDGAPRGVPETAMN